MNNNADDELQTAKNSFVNPISFAYDVAPNPSNNLIRG